MTYNFPFYLLKTIQSYLRCQKFDASYQAATSSRRGMRPGVPQAGLISPVLFCTYVNDMRVHCHHVYLVLYADDTEVIVTCLKPALLISYLEFYLADLVLWLRNWRFAINVSKRMALLFSRRQFHNPRAVALFCKPIAWVDTARYLGVDLAKRLTSLTHIDQVRKKASKRLGMLGRLLYRSGLSIRNGVLLFRQFIRPIEPNPMVCF